MQGRRARVEQALLTCCQIVQRRQGELFLFGSSVWSFAPGDIDLVVSGFRVEDQKDTERELRESTSFPLDIFWANRVPHLLEYKTGMWVVRGGNISLPQRIDVHQVEAISNDCLSSLRYNDQYMAESLPEWNEAQGDAFKRGNAGNSSAVPSLKSGHWSRNSSKPSWRTWGNCLNPKISQASLKSFALKRSYRYVLYSFIVFEVFKQFDWHWWCKR